MRRSAVLTLAAALVALVLAAPALSWTWPAGGPVVRAFSARRRSVRRRPAPRHRHRRRRRLGRARAGGGHSLVRGHGAEQRDDGDDPDGRRLRGHSGRAGLDRGQEGRGRERGAEGGNDRARSRPTARRRTFTSAFASPPIRTATSIRRRCCRAREPVADAGPTRTPASRQTGSGDQPVQTGETATDAGADQSTGSSRRRPAGPDRRATETATDAGADQSTGSSSSGEPAAAESSLGGCGSRRRRRNPSAG